ncbi:MAG TPA: peptide ABC transporter substrate-binding protein, partial [Ktedonobacteraceae bacterium]|nr:peptide ABC transporter substrate-binding protein [Ktedonobacteraceae bacterium]
QCGDTGCGPIVNLLFDGLVTLDKNLKVEAWGASSWTVSDDSLTYIFQLRPNQRFSDGTPVRASDYAWSIERSLSPCLGSFASYYLAAIKDARAFSSESCSASGQPAGSITTLLGDSIIPDDSANTLTIKLAQPAGFFLQALTYSTSYALEKSVVTGPNLGKDDTWLDSLAHGVTGQGGSGMFSISDWSHKSHLIVKPNPYWWGISAGKKPHFTSVEFSLFSKVAAAYPTYLSDQSFAYSDVIPSDLVATARGQPDYHATPALNIFGLVFNWKVAPFDDVNARRAFCESINRDQINTSILKNTNIPTWHIVPAGMPGYNKNLHGIDNIPTSGDTNTAKADWAKYKSAHPGANPTITLSFHLQLNEPLFMAEIIQALWNQLFGVNARIDSTPWNLIEHEMQAKTVQLYQFSWIADYPDPEDFLTLLFASDARYNFANESVPVADQLMKQADSLTDLSQRLPLYAKAEQMLVDQVAFCPLFQNTTSYRLRTWVKGGFIQDPQAMFPNDAWVSGYIAKH